LVDLPNGLDSSWHHAPARQIVTVLQGVLEVRTSDNQSHQWRAGELLFADDLTGKWHMTRTVGGAARLLIVQLPEGLDGKE
jgi:quercetin dioxygenase-like cupin family protein